MTVIMKVDLVGPKRRGLALGLNEFAGYFAVGVMSWVTGYIAAHNALRPQPFYLGIVIAVIGLMVSILFVRETRPYAHLEAATAPQTTSGDRPSLGHVFYVTTLGNVSLFAACQAGLVNNLNDGMSWGLYPLFFASYGLGVASIGIIKAVYPMVWGVLQVATGPLSDRFGRKELIAGGMIVQAAGIWLTVLFPAYGVAGRGRAAGTRHGDGLSRRCWRQLRTMRIRPGEPQPRRLPILARPRLCRRRPRLRRGCRFRRARGGDPPCRGAHVHLRSRGGLGDAEAAPRTGRGPGLDSRFARFRLVTLPETPGLDEHRGACTVQARMLRGEC